MGMFTSIVLTMHEWKRGAFGDMASMTSDMEHSLHTKYNVIS